MKEQNKSETVQEAVKDFIESECKYASKFYYTLSTEHKEALYDGFINGSHWQSTQLYTAEDCAKMLEDLRQRCAEEAKTVVTWSIMEAIEKIDVHQFIPPLTKQ